MEKREAKTPQCLNTEEFASLILDGSCHAVQEKSSNLQHEGGCKTGNCIPKDSQHDLYGCLVESLESRRQRVESSLRIAGKGFTSMTHYNLVHTFFLCLKQWGFRMQKQQWTRNGKSSKRFQHGNWRRSRVQRRLFSKHKETKRKSTLLHRWTSVTSRTRSENPNYKKKKKHKFRVVLRGDIEKDDSGAYAFFTEQGSSASQMTAAKVMDVITRLQDYQIVTDKQLMQCLLTLK